MSDQDEFEIEFILDERQKSGRTEYKVRWKGYSPEDDTWDTEADLAEIKNGLAKIKEFRDNLIEPKEPKDAKELKELKESTEPTAPKKPKVDVNPFSLAGESKSIFISIPESKKKIESTQENGSPPVEIENPRICGFDKGHVAESISGVTKIGDRIFVMVNWTNKSVEPELVPSDIVRYICPKLLIEFYQKRLSWQKPKTSL